MEPKQGIMDMKRLGKKCKLCEKPATAKLLKDYYCNEHFCSIKGVKKSYKPRGHIIQ